MSHHHDLFPLPKVEQSDVLYDEFFTIRRDLLHYPNGHKHRYYTVDASTPHAVSIIAITPEGKYLLIEEYRHATGKILLSCPGGFLDNSEDPIVAARRELLEETGYVADHCTLIGSTHPMSGLCSQKVSFVLAQKIKKVASPKLEPSEILRSILMTKKELYQQITNGSEADGMLCSALFFYDLTHGQ